MYRSIRPPPFVPSPFLLCTALLVVCTWATVATAGAPAGREDSAAPAAGASRLGPPPELRPIPEAGPRLPGARFERRRWLAAADAQMSHRPCPGWATRCRFDVGSAYRLALMSRPTPGFSWGPGVRFSSRKEVVSWEANSQETHTNAAAVTLGARLWLLHDGAFDPYVEVSSGVGSVVQRHRVSQVGRSERARAHGLAPVYSAALGLVWHLQDTVALGGIVSWTHWLLDPRDRCPAALGVCTYPPIAMFDAENGVISLGVSLDIAFGPPH